VQVRLPDRAKQRRWTVLIRWILALPLFIALGIIGVGVFFAVIVGWFAALITGRAPLFVRQITTYYLHRTLDFYAFAFLLTDRFPAGVAPDDRPDLPVQIFVPEATHLNRWAVLFRIILVIPVYLLASFVIFGLAVFIFFMWIVTLLTGWLPASVHDAYRAAIRFQIRVTAYLYLLVPTYPAGLFGDPDDVLPQALPERPVAALGDEDDDTSALRAIFAGQTGAPSQTPWTLRVSQGGRRVLVLAIVLGVPAYVANSVYTSHRFHLSTPESTSQINQDSTTLEHQFSQYATNTTACESSANGADCVAAADHVLAAQLRVFSNKLSGISVNGVNQADINRASSSAAAAAGALDILGNSVTSQAAYAKAVTSTGIQAKLTTLQSALSTLAGDISG
jgi:hypothetical protein